jgi:hypothetical protein
VSQCFAAAERLTQTHGRNFAQGIWGGLTLDERNTLAGLGLPPRPCPQCALICVPVNFATDRCSACDPQARIVYEDYRPQIMKMIESGATYWEIADALRLTRNSVGGACNRWNIRAQQSSKRGKRPRKECGTLAAKERHRKHGESWRDCACRHVPWRKGRPRKKPAPEVNAHLNVTLLPSSALMDSSKEVDFDTSRPPGKGQ